MTLNGQQHEQLSDALREAFRSPQRFTEFVKFRFTKNLYDITIADDLKELAFNLIDEADREGWIEELILAARQSNPNNSKLFVFAQDFFETPFIATPLPPQLSKRGELEKIIKETNGFLDVNTWRENLGKLEVQVCRIEFPQHRPQGTGFLIGADVVMTNYHVMEDVILGKVAPEDVVLRFDYKQLGDGKTINNGIEYRLVKSDWLIDESRPCVLEKQNPDELDYALLRVSGNPGKISVGERDSPQRGWINLPTKPYEFSLNTPLFILQHPKGKPLKLAIDAIIDVNDIIVRYGTNTEPGSSGSPCFDINWNLVALHHSGYTNYNAGTSFNAICSRLEKRGLLPGLLGDKEM
jgi:Effector-associated domain 1/Trypsin-like peptidase domain